MKQYEYQYGRDIIKYALAPAKDSSWYSKRNICCNLADSELFAYLGDNTKLERMVGEGYRYIRVYE